MKHSITLLTVLLTVVPNLAQSFSSGSDGRDGDLIVPASTTNNLVMPSDGIFRFKKINIGSNSVVTFTTNSLNTPVYLLATEDIVVSGRIDVSGKAGEVNQTALTSGGPGGFAGGPARQGGSMACGLGPAGGGNVSGSSRLGGGFANPGSYSNPNNYGNQLLIPLVGGSGGAGIASWSAGNSIVGASGGGGGGAILLASNGKIQIDGSILANGGRGSSVPTSGSGAGAGGAIRLVAPSVVGSGKLDATGGVGGYSGGAGGRIRIDSIQNVPASMQFGGEGMAALATIGRSMIVFPKDLPRLFLLNVAGQVIDQNSSGPVVVNLDSPLTNRQPVVVGGTGFRGDVSVEIIATPDIGDRYATNVVLKFPTDGSATVIGSNTLVFPTNRPTQVNAYVRYFVKP